MPEPKKPINFFKILLSFQWPGIAMDLRHGDAVYEIRNATGVGVGALPFGIRRTILAGLTQRF